MKQIIHYESKEISKTVVASIEPKSKNSNKVVGYDLNEIPPSNYNGRNPIFIYEFENETIAREWCNQFNKNQNIVYTNHGWKIKEVN